MTSASTEHELRRTAVNEYRVGTPPQAGKFPPMKPLILALSLLLPLAVLNAQNEERKPAVLPAKDATSKVGEPVTIEAKVAEVNKTEKLVRINLEARFPKQDLTLVIFPANFSKFEDVEKLEGKTVRVTGKGTEYQKRPQVVRDAKEQLKEQDIPDGPGTFFGLRVVTSALTRPGA